MASLRLQTAPHKVQRWCSVTVSVESSSTRVCEQKRLSSQTLHFTVGSYTYTETDDRAEYMLAHTYSGGECGPKLRSKNPPHPALIIHKFSQKKDARERPISAFSLLSAIKLVFYLILSYRRCVWARNYVGHYHFTVELYYFSTPRTISLLCIYAFRFLVSGM